MQQNNIKNNTTEQKHKHYELAYRAYYNNSFSPERIAQIICNEFDDYIKHLMSI